MTLRRKRRLNTDIDAARQQLEGAQYKSRMAEQQSAEIKALAEDNERFTRANGFETMFRAGLRRRGTA